MTPTADFGRTLGADLCAAWGLDPLRVERITLDITAGSLPVVTVTMFTDDATARIVTEYHLAAKANFNRDLSSASRAEP